MFAPADWARKLPAVLWGTATVGVLGALAGRRAGKTAGLLAALLLAFSPFHVRYSQEFRPYSLGLFLLCLSLLCLDRFLERSTAVRLLALYVACLATAYTLYLAAVVLAVAFASMLVEDCFSEDPVRRRAARRFLTASPLFALALFVAYLPWWPVVVGAARRTPAVPAEALTWNRLGRTLSFFAFASNDGDPGGLPASVWVVLLFVGAGIALRRRSLRFLLGWSFGGLLAIEILGHVHPHWYVTRRFLPAGVVFPVLLALPIASLFRSRGSSAGAVVLIALILAFDTRGMAGYFRDGRADWRPLARFLRGRPKQERIFTENQYSELCVAFYVEGPDWLYRGGHLGRDVWNLDGEIIRLTWSWKPGTTAWLVLAGEPRSEPLREWARALPAVSYPTAESAVLHRLEPGLRESVFPPGRR